MRQPGTVRLLIIRQLALAVKPWLHETTANIAIWMEPRKTRPLAHDRRRIRSETCTAAGVPGRIPHDFRRTAVRNLERAGVPRSAAMVMVGHKTESIYRRYAIVDAGVLREAAAKIDGAVGTIPGTMTGTQGKRADGHSA